MTDEFEVRNPKTLTKAIAGIHAIARRLTAEPELGTDHETVGVIHALCHLEPESRHLPAYAWITLRKQLVEDMQRGAYAYPEFVELANHLYNVLDSTGRLATVTERGLTP